MSDLIRDSFNQFYTAIGKSYQALNSDRIKIEDRKTKMLALLKDGMRIPEPPAEKGEYQDLCREMISSARLQLESWQELIQRKINQSEFVNRHERSILALVFADVNAGKSSLGNFVGGWNLQDTPYADLYIPHDCFIEEYSKASKENRQERNIGGHFPENATEATSTIQHYTLQQGLTWVDTPGLHSLTVEHGELTQEYIQFADLVIYLTPSSSPFKKDEREMLGNLFQMGKPVILAITKSDFTPPPAVQNGKLVRIPLAPKPLEKRQAQEAFVSEQVREISGNDNLENSHVLSLSVKLARNAVKAEDCQLYTASNLDGFLAQMGKILSEKAVELKMRRPKAEVNAFVDTLTGRSDVGWTDMLTIPQLQQDLREKRKELQTVMDACKIQEREICREVERQLPTALSLLFRNLRARDELGDRDVVNQEVSETVSLLVADCCRNKFQQLGQTVLTVNLPPVQIKKDDGEEYEKRYVEQIVTSSEERAPNGLFEHVIRLFDKDKKFYRVVNHTEQIPISDNFNTFLDKKLESIRPEVQAHVAQTINHMTQACIAPLMDCYQELDRQLESLAAGLEQLRFQ